jgi:hypothetical protein
MMTADGRPEAMVNCDVVVMGGGIAGTIAAIAAARLGADTVLIQDRSVLGGNSSSEVRVSPVGADFNNRHARESGILEELRLELAFRDRWDAPFGTGRPVPLWDAILWQWASTQSSLRLYLNTRVREAIVTASQLTSVIADQMTTEQSFRFSAPIFIDSTGDGSVAVRAGARFMLGREAREEFNESRGLVKADNHVLCSTLTFSARDTGKPVQFIAPTWAHKFPSCDDLRHRYHARKDYGYWWIEYGGELDPIRDSEKIRDELLKLLFGVWDHIKNHCDGSAANYALDFIGTVVGKRESRRFIGPHILTQNDLEAQIQFEDRVAFGGWPLDHNHPPAGILSKDPPGEMPQRHYLMEKTKRDFPKGVVVKHLFADPPAHWPDFLPPLPGLYSIPLRALHSADVENLFLAGRNISATHIAFGSTRVQGTTGVIGQAAGTAAAVCALRKLLPGQLTSADVIEIQQILLREDAYIPGCRNTDPADVARSANVASSSQALLAGVEPGSQSDARGGSSRGYTIEEGQHASVARDVRWPLDVARGQMFQVSAARIDSVALLLRRTGVAAKAIPVTLHRASSLGCFRENAVATVEVVPPGGQEPSWIVASFECDVTPGLYWISVPATPGLSWLEGAEAPLGTYRAAWFPEYKSWDRLFDCHAFRLSPPSRPYGPENVINGVARPEAEANIWISDPHKPMPQWIELSWDQPQSIGAVLLTFDTHLDAMLQLGTIGAGAAPECPRDYKLLIEANGEMHSVASVEGNFQRRRRHEFDPVTTKRLRLLITATNGHHSARVYEIRAYREIVSIRRTKGSITKS